MDTDFLKMNFGKLFLKKHGEQVFNDVSKKIMQEKLNNCNNDYVEIVFKVAFLDSFGLDEIAIEKIIKYAMSVKNINVKEIKSIHNHSIKEIQNRLQSSIK